MIVESYEEVIKVSGALRTNQWDTLHTAISLGLKRHPEGVIIDTSGLTECTLQGADTFHSVMEFLKGHDARVIVAAVPPNVMETLKGAADVRSQLPIAESVEEARKSLFFFTGGELHEEENKPKRGKSIEHKYRFLVALQGTECDTYVLTTAREMADGMEALVNVVYPILVPRDMPLQAPLPEEEEKARETLTVADSILKRDEVAHALLLERARDVASALVSVLEEHPASHVILGMPPEDSRDSEVKLVKSVLTKITKQAVILVRGPQE